MTMMPKRCWLSDLSFLLLMTACLGACGGGDGAAPDDVVSPAPDGVTVDAPSDAEAVDVPSGDDDAGDVPGETAGETDAAGDGAGDDAGDDAAPVEVPCEGILQPLVHEAGADDTFRRGPYIQSVMGEQAVVVWRDEAGGVEEGCVEYEQASGEPQMACATPDEAGQYEVALTGLARGARVTYRVSVAERRAGPFDFWAAPADDTPVRLLVFADSHANAETLGRVVAAALDDGVHLAVGVGDLVSQPEESQWDSFFEGLRPLGHRVPFWPVLGNHENKHPSYFHAFVVPGAAPAPRTEMYYGVRQGNVWIGVLQLDDLAVAGFLSAVGAEVTVPESVWLTEALRSEEARTARWRLLFLHETPYAQGWGACDHYQGEVTLRDYLIPLAAEHGVSAIFSGHMHGYERGEQDGVTLVSTGGAGGGLDSWCEPEDALPQPWFSDYVHHRTIVDAGCDELTIEARDLDDRLVDRVVLH